MVPIAHPEGFLSAPASHVGRTTPYPDRLIRDNTFNATEVALNFSSAPQHCNSPVAIARSRNDRPAIDPGLFLDKWLDLAADAPNSSLHHIGISQAIGFASLQAHSIPHADDTDWMPPSSMWRFDPPRLARVARKHAADCRCPLPSCRARVAS